MRIIHARYRNGNDFLRHYQPAFDAGGLFYPTREALEVGAPVIIEVRFPSLPQRLMLRGTVAWRRAGRHSTKLRAGLGIEFHENDLVRRDFLLSAARGEIPDRSALVQRKHRRLPVDLPAEWRIPHDRVSHQGQLEDISAGGAFIRTAETIPQGSEVFLDVVPPGSLLPLTIAARAAWSRPPLLTDDGQVALEGGFGMEFRSRDAGGMRRLKELVRRIEQLEREAMVEEDVGDDQEAEPAPEMESEPDPAGGADDSDPGSSAAM